MSYPLYLLNKEEVIETYYEKETDFEKIQYLKHCQEYSCIAIGVAYYTQDCEKHVGTVPATWRGVISARAGINNSTHLSVEDSTSFIVGYNQWLLYCELGQMILNLEHGKNASFISSFTHRQEAIAYTYRIKSGEAETVDRKKIIDLWGHKRAQAFDSINSQSKAFRSPKRNDLEKAVEILQNYPAARALAFKDIQD